MELLAGTQNDQIQFVVSISQEETERKLILQFYKSQRINWVAMDRALEMAQTLQKPIHAVAVDGPLHDEACCKGSGKFLRAVALSDKPNIEFLNAIFINTWVLNTDIKRLRDAQGMETIPPLARAIMQGTEAILTRRLSNYLS